MSWLRKLFGYKEPNQGIEELARGAGAWLVASVAGNKPTGVEGLAESFVNGFLSLCTKLDAPPPSLSRDDLRHVSFELVSFAAFHAVELARGRRRLTEEQKVLFSARLLDAVSQYARGLGDDVIGRIREYWGCAKPEDTLDLFSRRTAFALLGEHTLRSNLNPQIAHLYVIAKDYSAQSAVGYLQLANGVLDCCLH
jgi:hypothetical protein